MLTPKTDKYLCDGDGVFGSFDSSLKELDPHVVRRKRSDVTAPMCLVRSGHVRGHFHNSGEMRPKSGVNSE